MEFPASDRYWTEALTFLEQHAQPLDAILAPNEFLEFFPGTYHYNISYLLPADRFAFHVFHKGMVTQVEQPFLLEVLQYFQPVFANSVFVIYANALIDVSPADEHIQPLLNQISQQPHNSSNEKQKYAAVVTTYNRPQCLARSLPQILALNIPTIVIDDASTPENQKINQSIIDKYQDKYQVLLLQIPSNRGLPNSINTGISYWLADPDITWISYFQDDVDVSPDLIKVMAQIQDCQERPLLTGRDATEHPTFKSTNIADRTVLLKRSIPGIHLHAHRNYWASVLPIPTPYLGCPKANRGRLGQGADEDWWIATWSPNSVVKQGGYVVCVPNLVTTFDTTGQNSTWQNFISSA